MHGRSGLQWDGKFSALQNASAGMSSNWVSTGEDGEAELMLLNVVIDIDFGPVTVMI